MSEQESLFLDSIGLLGEYCPTFRKKHLCLLEDFAYLHLEPFLEITIIQDCNSEPFSAVVTSEYCTEENRVLVSSVIA